MGERDIVTTFAKCSRLLSGAALEVKDEFLSQLCSKESDKLLAAFIGFLKIKGENTAKSSDIAQHKNHVAQCRYQLIFQIKNILNLAQVLSYFGFLRSATPLLLEKNLLLLELAVLDSFNKKKDSYPKAGKSLPAQNPKPRKKSVLSTDKLSRTHKEIIDLINSKERTQNSEIFGRLNGTSRRTLKRKLSELLQLKIIKRFSEGKKVFYAAAADSTPTV